MMKRIIIALALISCFVYIPANAAIEKLAPRKTFKFVCVNVSDECAFKIWIFNDRGDVLNTLEIFPESICKKHYNLSTIEALVLSSAVYTICVARYHIPTAELSIDWRELRLEKQEVYYFECDY
jgi:hypothetical protein